MKKCGNPMYHYARRKLDEVGISYNNHTARQITNNDYKKFDYIIGMEERNIKDIKRIVGNDTDKKIYRLLDFTINPRDIADPWYTGNFDVAYQDILEGCQALLKELIQSKKI